MKHQEFPQRYYDALNHPNPARTSLMSKLLTTLFIKGEAEPSLAQREAYGRLMMVGDPQADAWGKRENSQNRAKWYQQFNRALEHGTASVADAPDELVALLAKAENEPLWLDRHLLNIGARAYCRVGPMAHLVMRSIGLAGGYMSAPITKPLIFTGALKTGTSRRLVETANFGFDVTRPGGLERNAPGFKTALRVRMMHGIIRKRILNAPGWRTDLWGIPINQADMLITHITMSYVFILGHRLLGYRFSQEEVIALLHLWRYVGYLMGIDNSLLPTTEQEARRLLWLGIYMQPGPDEDSISLAKALKDVELDKNNPPLTQWLDGLNAKLQHGLSRLALGKDLAESLEIPDTPWKYWPFVFTPFMFTLETARIHTPFASRLAFQFGKRYEAYRNKIRLQDREAAYVPAVDLTEKANQNNSVG